MNLPKLTIFIGYDPVENIAFHTLIQSITHYSSNPVMIVPVNIRNLKTHFHRERDPKQSNEFSFSRFLVPHLMDYNG
ncbi:MAG: glycosyltransferase, partial [Saprospiraceae bacterium]